jgi:hypothetical protein
MGREASGLGVVPPGRRRTREAAVEATRLGRVVGWAVGLVACGVLVVVAAATAYWSPRRLFGGWWVAAALGLGLMMLAGRLFGGRARRRWRALKAPPWALPAALFAVFFAVKLGAALGLKTEQRSDFLVIYQAAQDIVAGDFSFNQTPYWDFFAYQTPFALFEAAVLRISGGSLIPLLVGGAAAMAGINLLVYLAGRRIAQSTLAGLGAAGAYLVFTDPYLYAPTLSSDHLSTFLGYLGAYMVLAAMWPPARWGSRSAAAPRGEAQLRPPTPRRPAALALGGGLVLALANLARPLGLMVWVALVAAAIAAALIARRRGESLRRPAAAALALLAAGGVYVGTIAVVDSAVRASGVNPAGVRSGLPEWKFVLGLAGPEGSAADLAAIGAYGEEMLPGAREKAEAALARNLRDLPANWKSIVERQLRALWVRHDDAIWAFNPQLADLPLTGIPKAQSDTLAYIMVASERGLFLPVVVLAGLGVARLTWRRRWGRAALFCVCFMVAYAAIHLAIEAQPRYRYPVMPAIFALTAPAVAVVADGGLRRCPRQAPPRPPGRCPAV